MKTRSAKLMTILLSAILILAFITPLTVDAAPRIWKSKKDQQIDTLLYRVYKGKIIDSETRQPLIFATISVVESNLATVSNSDGEFLLKINKDLPVEKIQITYIGYKSLIIPINTLKPERNLLSMETASVPLMEVRVYPHDPVFIIKSILKNVKENYSTQPNMMKGFYRETIKKNRNYVAISEAVVNIHKASYTQLKDDQVQIFKGRKSTDVKRMDTLLFKLQGGPYTSLLMDLIKNPYTILSEDFLDNYDYKMSNITKIDGKLHYVVEFKQKKEIDLPLYYGLLYVDADNMALTSAKFSLNLENKPEASKLFIRKKPTGVKVTPTSANYLVNYRKQQGKWHFNYARGEINFKCNWKRRLFNTNYSAMSEIAITDRDSDNIMRFRSKEKFSARDVMVDQVNNFSDKNYWGSYNTIEPDQSIESAIRKLKRRNDR